MLTSSWVLWIECVALIMAMQFGYRLGHRIKSIGEILYRQVTDEYLVRACGSGQTARQNIAEAASYLSARAVGVAVDWQAAKELLQGVTARTPMPDCANASWQAYLHWEVHPNKPAPYPNWVYRLKAVPQ